MYFIEIPIIIPGTQGVPINVNYLYRLLIWNYHRSEISMLIKFFK